MKKTQVSVANLNSLKCVCLTIVACRVGSTEIGRKYIAPSGAPDDVTSLGSLGGRATTMSETASRAVRIMGKMFAMSMLKGVVCRIGDLSLDGRGLDELDCSHEGHQYSVQ